MNRWNKILDFDPQVRLSATRRNGSILRFDVLSFYVKRDLIIGTLDSKLTPFVRSVPLFRHSGSSNHDDAGEDFVLRAGNHTGNRPAQGRLRCESKSHLSEGGEKQTG